MTFSSSLILTFLKKFFYFFDDDNSYLTKQEKVDIMIISNIVSLKNIKDDIYFGNLDNLLKKERIKVLSILRNHTSIRSKKIKSLFKNKAKPEKILPTKNWYKKFEKYWTPSENDAGKLLQNFINKKVKDYGTLRDYPSINGTSRLSPYIRSGQIHVSSIWRKCNEIKPKNIGIKKIINRINKFLVFLKSK